MRRYSHTEVDFIVAKVPYLSEPLHQTRETGAL